MGWDVDYAIIGSGFGGSVAALRLAEKGYRVAVLEQGRRWTPDRLPRSTWDLRRWLWMPRLGLRGFFSMRLFGHVMVLHGNAVGGGSITYAATLLQPPDHVWDQGGWAGLADWRAVMPGHFATARRMLGVTANRRPGPADARLREMAVAAGVGDSFRPTEVGLFFGPEGDDMPGKVHPDPFFGGRGPDRRACIGCGACMIGCRHGAKNTLDLNYLHLAEAVGATIHAETRVTRLRALSPDGGAGYELTLSGARAGRMTARGVVVAGSALGSVDLLLRAREAGDLPRLSPILGRHVRTNAESLIGIRWPGSPVDLSKGVAIGSGIHLPGGTHIEATRYPAGSDAMALITTLLARGGLSGWLAALAGGLIRRPRQMLRLLKPRGWARESMIFLCMQSIEGELTLRRRRRWFAPWRRGLSSTGPRIPSHIPEATEFALAAARDSGGTALASLNEMLLRVPMTAHCIGGATMGRSRDDGVCDARGRVFGYDNLLICDGSILSANLGVNPSLTITALAEHVIGHVPAADRAGADQAGAG